MFLPTSNNNSIQANNNNIQINVNNNNNEMNNAEKNNQPLQINNNIASNNNNELINNIENSQNNDNVNNNIASNNNAITNITANNNNNNILSNNNSNTFRWMGDIVSVPLPDFNELKNIANKKEANNTDNHETKEEADFCLADDVFFAVSNVKELSEFETLTNATHHLKEGGKLCIDKEDLSKRLFELYQANKTNISIVCRPTYISKYFFITNTLHNSYVLYNIII